MEQVVVPTWKKNKLKNNYEKSIWAFRVSNANSPHTKMCRVSSTLKKIIWLTLGHIRMTYTTPEKNLLYNTI
jgi:hypothetical protein